ncbi:XRE family transcriptional regulator [Klebsiella pneumoniae]|uniref:XRE family transcriptional regulator n=2 Tax=Klebsiella TaxID=570 RepID=UPI003D67CB4E
MSELIVHASDIMIEHMVHEERARKEFSQRLALACDKAGLIPHGRQAEIAKRMKLTPKAVSKWFNGESIPRRGTLQALASHIGTSASYLLGDADDDGIEPGSATNRKDIFRIDLLDIAVSAGPGVINQEFVEILRSVEYAPAEANHMFDGRKAENIRIINVRGDSMSGTIEPGDLLFVDVSVRKFDGDGIYAFLYDDTAHVKRLQKMKDKLLVISDNKSYAAWDPIEKDEMNRVFVFGKVIGSMPQTYRKHG